MTDQTIPADKVQKIAADLRNAMRRVEDGYQDGEFLMDMSGYIKDLEALLPAPPRPTLADMTEEERDACQRMQCDVRNAVVTHGVLAKNHGGDAHVLDAEGEVWFLSPTDVTPRPDLPRLEWPGDQKPAPATALPDGFRLADHKDYGRVMVTTHTPNIEGRIYYVLPVGRNLMGFDWRSCDPDMLTYLDQEADTSDAAPPNTLAVGTMIESADDPRLAALPVGSILGDRDGGVFDVTKTDTGEWDGPGYVPEQGTGTTWGPWTIRRIGKGADQ